MPARTLFEAEANAESSRKRQRPAPTSDDSEGEIATVSRTTDLCLHADVNISTRFLKPRNLHANVLHSAPMPIRLKELV